MAGKPRFRRPFHQRIKASVGPVLSRFDVDADDVGDDPIGAIHHDQGDDIPDLVNAELGRGEGRAGRVRAFPPAGWAGVGWGAVGPDAVFMEPGSAGWTSGVAPVRTGKPRLLRRGRDPASPLPLFAKERNRLVKLPVRAPPDVYSEHEKTFRGIGRRLKERNRFLFFLFRLFSLLFLAFFFKTYMDLSFWKNSHQLEILDMQVWLQPWSLLLVL